MILRSTKAHASFLWCTYTRVTRVKGDREINDPVDVFSFLNPPLLFLNLNHVFQSCSDIPVFTLKVNNIRK